MQAEFGEDAFHAANADDPARLFEFLGDDLGGGIRVQEAVANDLTNHLISPAIFRTGTALLSLQEREFPPGERLCRLGIES